jgi:hypothetical protein
MEKEDLNLDGNTLNVTCPMCGNKFQESIGRIKSVSVIPCVCGHAINLANLQAEVHMLEKSFFNIRDKVFRDIKKS